MAAAAKVGGIAFGGAAAGAVGLGPARQARLPLCESRWCGLCCLARVLSRLGAMLGLARVGRGAGNADAPSAAPAWTVKTLEEVTLACGTRSAQLRRCLEASAEQRAAAEDGTRVQAVSMLHESAATRSKCEKLALDLLVRSRVRVACALRGVRKERKERERERREKKTTR